MLLDPFEKEFHLPAAAVQFGDGERGQDEIVGQEYEGLGCFGILEADAAQRGLEALVRVEAREGGSTYRGSRRSCRLGENDGDARSQGSHDP